MTDFQVMAGNDLRTGRVVYLTTDGNWSSEIEVARRLEGDEAVCSAKELAGTAVDGNQVVDPYLVKLTVGMTPSHIREKIRHSGPTCLPGLHTSGSAVSVQIAG